MQTASRRGLAHVCPNPNLIFTRWLEIGAHKACLQRTVKRGAEPTLEILRGEGSVNMHLKAMQVFPHHTSAFQADNSGYPFRGMGAVCGYSVASIFVFWDSPRIRRTPLCRLFHSVLPAYDLPTQVGPISKHGLADW